MYGFPEELYQLQYPVKGYAELTKEVCCLLGDDVSINDSWGIDHGTWSVMVHMFPDASIPVVQLSVNGNLKPEQCVEIGRKLAPLREQGYLIWGSGNIVHNLRRIEWNNRGGSDQAERFSKYIVDSVLKATSMPPFTTKTTKTQPIPSRHRTTICRFFTVSALPETIRQRYLTTPAPWGLCPWPDSSGLKHSVYR